MEIQCLKGTEKRMYELIAPLIMNADIIRINNNYPFKTSEQYLWYVIINNGAAESFMPLKPTKTGYCIDNYYIKDDDKVAIDTLLKRILDDLSEYNNITALVCKRHVKYFIDNGFVTWMELKNYNKMDYKSGEQ